MYELVYTKTFDESYSKIIKEDLRVEKRAIKALNFLQYDPFYPSLNSHKVNTKNFGESWSSWITGDLRIIWDFDEENKQVILLFVIAKHSGSHREYK